MSFGAGRRGDPEDAVLDLSRIRGTDAGRVGPKVARLGQLARDGWRVPDGYAVTVEAMAGWLLPDAGEEAARLAAAGEYEPARELIEAQPPPAWLAEAVAQAMDAWDIAAGQLILQEAGGRLTTFSGVPHTTAERADIVATNGHIHDDLVNALKGLTLGERA